MPRTRPRHTRTCRTYRLTNLPRRTTRHLASRRSPTALEADMLGFPGNPWGSTAGRRSSFQQQRPSSRPLERPTPRVGHLVQTTARNTLRLPTRHRCAARMRRVSWRNVTLRTNSCESSLLARAGRWTLCSSSWLSCSRCRARQKVWAEMVPPARPCTRAAQCRSPLARRTPCWREALDGAAVLHPRCASTTTLSPSLRQRSHGLQWRKAACLSCPEATRRAR